MVCETDENRILAEFMLSTIVKFIQEYVTSHEQGNAEVSNNNNKNKLPHPHLLPLTNTVLLCTWPQLMLKAEKATIILHQFLPNGQLIFMNHKVIAQYKKQLEKLVT